MTTEKKMTKREKFAMLMNIEEVKNDPILTEFIEHELELLAKKNSAEKKPTAQQTANEALKAEIFANMEPNRLYTITEMIKEFACCAELSTPKVSAIVRLLKEEGKVVRTEDKRKAYFSLA